MIYLFAIPGSVQNKWGHNTTTLSTLYYITCYWRGARARVAPSFSVWFVEKYMQGNQAKIWLGPFAVIWLCAKTRHGSHFSSFIRWQSWHVGQSEGHQFGFAIGMFVWNKKCMSWAILWVQIICIMYAFLHETKALFDTALSTALQAVMSYFLPKSLF